MINFLPKSDKFTTPLDGIKHLTYAITTLVIVIFVICVSIILGIRAYQNIKQQELTKQIDNLTSEINKLSTKEAKIRQIDLRLKAIDKFIDTRAKSSSQLKSINLMNGVIAISDWNFASGKVGVVSSSSADLQTYVQALRLQFVNLHLDTTEQKGDLWKSVLTLK